MDKVSVLKMRDKDEDQEALAIVRSVNGFVALTLSLEHEGDVEIAFTPTECQDLVLRLQEAIADAKGEALVSGPRAAVAPTANPTAPTISEFDYNGIVKNG